MPCVYALTSSADPTHYRYIGITKYETPQKRLAQHIKDAKGGKKSYKCNLIRNILDSGNFVVPIILETTISWDKACEAEIFYIADYRNRGHKLTNITAGGEGGLGLSHTLETRAKISEAKRGKKRSPEFCAKMSQINKGKKLSPETCAKMSELRRGLKHSSETRAKISAANKGRKMSPEQCAKLAHSKRGKNFSPQHCAKLSEARLGSKRSVETRAKMSQARRNYWVARRLAVAESVRIVA
jgi:hypothetical protein